MNSKELKVDVKLIGGSNEIVANLARTTVSKGDLSQEAKVRPTFIHRMYLSEHSPIRSKMYQVYIENIPSWIATHLVRHHVGYEPFVSTQRDDRNSEITDRDSTPQGALVNIKILLNAQAFISVSRRRLCTQAHPRTRRVWEKVIEELKLVDYELAQCCVPDCVYRGFCYEIEPCDYHTSIKYAQRVHDYRRVLVNHRKTHIMKESGLKND